MYTGKETKLGKEGRKEGRMGESGCLRNILSTPLANSLNSVFLSFYHRFSFPTCTLKIPTSILPYTPPRLLKTNKQTKDKQKKGKRTDRRIQTTSGDPHAHRSTWAPLLSSTFSHSVFGGIIPHNLGRFSLLFGHPRSFGLLPSIHPFSLSLSLSLFVCKHPRSK